MFGYIPFQLIELLKCMYFYIFEPRLYILYLPINLQIIDYARQHQMPKHILLLPPSLPSILPSATPTPSHTPLNPSLILSLLSIIS